jgi:hypothetical protein
VAKTARVLMFDVDVDNDRSAHSALGGTPIAYEHEWWAEHLVLAGLVRCTLASMDYSAHGAGLEATGGGRAHGVVTRRDDGLYAFVEVEAFLEIALDPLPEPELVHELIAKAEHGCFVGNSLTAKPRYRWTINGEDFS